MFGRIHRKSQKESSKANSICCLFTYFGMKETIFVFTFFLSSNACSKFHVLSMYVMKLEWLHDSRLLFYDLPKRGPVEILARCSIFSRSQTKVIDAPFCPGYYVFYYFYFCWASGLFVSRFECKPRTFSVYVIYWVFNIFCFN